MCFLYADPDSREISFFFFNDTATTEIYTLSLHDALPISPAKFVIVFVEVCRNLCPQRNIVLRMDCRRSESTRLNSSHSQISYAVFCLKKKNAKHRGSKNFVLSKLAAASSACNPRAERPYH